MAASEQSSHLERHPVRRKIKKDRTVGQKQDDGYIKSNKNCKYNFYSSLSLDVETHLSYMAVWKCNYVTIVTAKYFLGCLLHLNYNSKKQIHTEMLFFYVVNYLVNCYTKWNAIPIVFQKNKP